MKICFVPIDNRPVCYSLANDICSIDNDIELFLPPRELLGDLNKIANISEILNWLKSCPKVDAIVLSLDTLTYGGLIPSRRTTETFQELKNRLDNLKQILKEKNASIYAFSSIMRISNNNYNEEEKEYWSEYGKKIFEYSFSGGKNKSDIPQEIIDDYLQTRKRNFEINKIYLEWQKESFFDTLIFSKDDCAEYGFNVDEAKELEKLGGKTKTGADEIPLSLLSRAIKKDVKIFVQFTEPDCKDLISNYEDVSIEKSVLGQLELGGFKVVDTVEESDIVLIVNNFREKQGELVMGWQTGARGKCIRGRGKYIEGGDVLPSKPFAIADVRYANGADNDFVEDLLDHITPLQQSHKCHEVTKGGRLDNFYGYAAWNTSANTLGSLLACVKVKFKAKKYNEKAFKRLQMIRFLDDWAYQANVRAQIDRPCDIKEKMKPYEEILSKIFDSDIEPQYIYPKYIYPWNRKFEVEVCL